MLGGVQIHMGGVAYMVNTYSTYSKRPLKGHVFCPKYVEYVEYEVECVEHEAPIWTYSV